MPLLWDLVEGLIEEKNFLSTYDELRTKIKASQKNTKPGLDQFTIMMQMTRWGDLFGKDDIRNIWNEAFSRVEDAGKSALAKKPTFFRSSTVSTGTSSPKISLSSPNA